MTSGSQTSACFGILWRAGKHADSWLGILSQFIWRPLYVALTSTKLSCDAYPTSSYFVALIFLPRHLNSSFNFPYPLQYSENQLSKNKQTHTHTNYFLHICEWIDTCVLFILGYQNSKINYEVETCSSLKELAYFGQSVLFHHGEWWESRSIIRLGFENQREQRQRGMGKKMGDRLNTSKFWLVLALTNKLILGLTCVVFLYLSQMKANESLVSTFTWWSQSFSMPGH